MTKWKPSKDILMPQAAWYDALATPRMSLTTLSKVTYPV